MARTLSPSAPDLDRAESIRRDFAHAWGRIGAAWGVAPSTAAVQGYLLLHGGPLTSAEIQGALGLSHRATRTAIADCEAWGIIDRAPQPRRGGSRGPAGTAWLPVGDHWEWFRRVSASRLERETDPVLPLLDGYLADARTAPQDEPGIPELLGRLEGLVDFTHRFDRAVEVVVRLESADIGHLFDVLDRIPDEPARRAADDARPDARRRPGADRGTAVRDDTRRRSTGSSASPASRACPGWSASRSGEAATPRAEGRGRSAPPAIGRMDSLIGPLGTRAGRGLARRTMAAASAIDSGLPSGRAAATARAEGRSGMDARSCDRPVALASTCPLTTRSARSQAWVRHLRRLALVAAWVIGALAAAIALLASPSAAPR